MRSGRAGASHPQHDGDGAQIAHLLAPVSIVHLPLEACTHLAAVGGMALSALGGQDVAVLERHLVRRRQDGLVEEDVLDAHRQPVAAANLVGLGIRVAVEEDLGADVLDALLQLAAGGEDGIERVNVGVDGGGERGVSRLVLGRALEQLLSPAGVEAGGPRRRWLARCGRRHGGGGGAFRGGHGGSRQEGTAHGEARGSWPRGRWQWQQRRRRRSQPPISNFFPAGRGSACHQQ